MLWKTVSEAAEEYPIAGATAGTVRLFMGDPTPMEGSAEESGDDDGDDDEGDDGDGDDDGGGGGGVVGRSDCGDVEGEFGIWVSDSVPRKKGELVSRCFAVLLFRSSFSISSWPKWEFKKPWRIAARLFGSLQGNRATNPKNDYTNRATVPSKAAPRKAMLWKTVSEAAEEFPIAGATAGTVRLFMGDPTPMEGSAEESGDDDGDGDDGGGVVGRSDCGDVEGGFDIWVGDTAGAGDFA
ncbi:hypothetical protein SUGI_0988580 [Cryptomeria japonica]|nr:hypothetical protein SUGI_0988580 [Cryptomeria japonica]